MSTAPPPWAQSLHAASGYLELARARLVASFTGIQHVRRSALRHGYLRARGFAGAALAAAARRLDRRSAPRRTTLEALESRMHALRTLEQRALTVGALSRGLLLDELAEQLAEQDPARQAEALLAYAHIGKPLLRSVMSEQEVLSLTEYVHQRIGRRVAWDSLVDVLARTQGQEVQWPLQGTDVEGVEVSATAQLAQLAMATRSLDERVRREFAMGQVVLPPTPRAPADRALGDDLRAWFEQILEPYFESSQILELPPFAPVSADRGF